MQCQHENGGKKINFSIIIAEYEDKFVLLKNPMFKLPIILDIMKKDLQYFDLISKHNFIIFITENFIEITNYNLHDFEDKVNESCSNLLVLMVENYVKTLI